MPSSGVASSKDDGEAEVAAIMAVIATIISSSMYFVSKTMFKNRPIYTQACLSGLRPALSRPALSPQHELYEVYQTTRVGRRYPLIRSASRFMAVCLSLLKFGVLFLAVDNSSKAAS